MDYRPYLDRIGKALEEFNTRGEISLPCPVCGSKLKCTETKDCGELFCEKEGCFKVGFRGL